MKKRVIKEFSFIKAVCALGIIAFHFSCHLESKEFLIFHSYKNGPWGSVFVTMSILVR